MEFLSDVTVNVVANLIAAAIVVLASSAIVYWGFVRRHRRFLRFFGVTERNPALSIYVSRLEVQPGGAIGFTATRRGYFGPAIARNEYRAALLVRDALRVRFIGRLPRGIQDWLREQSVTLRDLDPQIDVSPTTVDDIPPDNLISLGGELYNLVTKHFWTRESVRFYFEKDSNNANVLKVRQPGVTDIEIPRTQLNRELAALACVRLPERVVIICVGSDSSATYGCVKYLMDKWSILDKQYGQDDFGMCLAFPEQHKNSERTVEPEVVYAYPHQLRAS